MVSKSILAKLFTYNESFICDLCHFTKQKKTFLSS